MAYRHIKEINKPYLLISSFLLPSILFLVPFLFVRVHNMLFFIHLNPQFFYFVFFNHVYLFEISLLLFSWNINFYMASPFIFLSCNNALQWVSQTITGHSAVFVFKGHLYWFLLSRMSSSTRHKPRHIWKVRLSVE